MGVVETQWVSIELPPEGLTLEGGGALPELRVAYETYGELSENRDNAIFICHALSGDAHAAGRHAPDPAGGGANEVEGRDEAGWWDEMVGPGKGIDTRYYFVICANILGGCRGTTGPSSKDPRTGRPYGSAFPTITVGDIVTVHHLLVRRLGIEKLAAVVGGSFGGMQALEWAIRFPEEIESAICIASAVSLTTQALAFDVVGRHAITSDPDWQAGDYYETGRFPSSGLAQARKIGHITYLSPGMMTRKFGRSRRDGREEAAPSAPTFKSTFQVESYLDHQGEKFLKRFDANSYLHITRAMDEYDLKERFGKLEDAFEGIRAKILVVALSEDWLFPSRQSIDIAHALLRAGKPVSYCRLAAPHGHDAFLVDVEHLREVIRAFLPWIGPGGRAGPGLEPDRSHRRRRSSRRLGKTSVAPWPAGTRQQEFGLIRDMMRPDARILDLGCGDGELLTLLAREKATATLGVDIDIEHVMEVIDRGHDIFQADIDAGLAMIPDGAYNYAVLSETLQVVRRPRFVLQEMLRVAGEGIVSFPNFGKWSRRLGLWVHGRMPKGGSLPFDWYDTPNIHLFTMKDFDDLCRRDGIRILERVCIPSCTLDGLMVRAGCFNLGADRVLVRITRS